MHHSWIACVIEHVYRVGSGVQGTGDPQLRSDVCFDVLQPDADRHARGVMMPATGDCNHGGLARFLQRECWENVVGGIQPLGAMSSRSEDGISAAC